MGKYIIKTGDTLSSIAKMNGTTVNKLASANGITNPNLIYAGNTLIIPDAEKTSDGNEDKIETETDAGWNGYTSFVPNEFQKSDETIAAEGYHTSAKDALDKHGTLDESWWNGVVDAENAYKNRGDFSYDFNADALYQQYKDKYIKQGKMAMQDVIGQASAMTGGYGNSYAATAGNQAYQSSLENLNDVIPELYQMAYDRYNQKGQELLNAYDMALNNYNMKYGEHQDTYNRLFNEMDYWGTQAANLYNRDRGTYEFDTNLAQSGHQTQQGYLYQGDRDKVEDQKWQDDYDLKKRAQDIADEEWAYKKKAYEDEQNNTVKKEDAPKVEDEPKATAKSYSGTSRDEAINFVKSNGVPSAHASGIMTAGEWSRRKSSYQLYGQGGAEVKNYNTYQEYLEGITEYLIEKYNQ